MASIYIHIPYCKQACYYCNFHFSTSLNSLPSMIDAICHEMELRNKYIDEPIDSVYFGGGTPSILDIEHLAKIIETTKRLYAIRENAEITLEANPDDISEAKLQEWKSLGINRFSLGVQSFHEKDLQWMHRAHNAQQAESSIRMIQNAGFQNITIDLIYGTPTLSDEDWKINVEKAIHLNIPHLSCYALTIEPGTALDKMVHLHKKENVQEEKQARHFELLMQWTKVAGYDHYEVSNFGKPGFHSKHNSSYWQGKSYIGIGPSAHSFDRKSRQWNIANNVQYIASIKKDIVPFEIEQLTPQQQLEEYIMTSLRTMEGLSLKKIAENWGQPEAERIEKISQKYLKQAALTITNRNITLTDKGFLLADGIAADLF